MNNYKVEKLPKMQKSNFEIWMARLGGPLAIIAFIVMQFTGGPRDDAPAEPETKIVSTAVPESGSPDNGTGASFNFEIHTGGSN